MSQTLFGSLTRIADVDRVPFETTGLDRAQWESGDYVVGEVSGDRTELYRVECRDGELLPVADGDRVVGAFGHRAATLEGVGSHEDIEDGRMHALTSAGLFGRFTSYSMLLPPPIKLRYLGHVMRNGEKVCMRDFAIRADPADLVPFEKYANAASSLAKPSSAARALAAGATNIERVDRLVQTIAASQGKNLAAIDEIVDRVDTWLSNNREAA